MPVPFMKAAWIKAADDFSFSFYSSIHGPYKNFLEIKKLKAEKLPSLLLTRLSNAGSITGIQSFSVSPKKILPGSIFTRESISLLACSVFVKEVRS
jgi:hypothetical protein